jgi:gluconate 2-dehydrogenase gamma chain
MIRVERRRFLAALALSALPAAGCRRRPAPAAVSCAVNRTSDGPGRTLDAEQWSTLRAACARLVPSDGEPGAEEANVVAFIDDQLAHPPVSGFHTELALGLRQMNSLARRQGASSFAGLQPAGQDEVLRQLQRGMRLGRGDSRHFFLVLLTLTLEGFLGDPVYGGNRDEAGWRFLRFRPRPPRPRCPYRGAQAQSPPASRA